MSATTIKTIVEAGQVKVFSPYNTDFVRKARNLQGNFSGGAWVFPEAVKEHVLNATREIYGVDGVEEYATCTLCISEFSDRGSYCAGYELFGRQIARAFGRDSGAKLSDDIILVSGKITSDGSMKNWYTRITDATFEIHNFPVAALEREDVKEGMEEGWLTVKGLPEAQATPEKPTRSEVLTTLEEAVHKVFLCEADLLEKADQIAFIKAATKLIESLK